jgi:Arc/MetJ-type ribon-helix-helix transcriptional regulator
MVNSPTIGIRFSREDIELLDALVEKEERSRSDVVRRAIRAYAQAHGMTTTKPKKKTVAKR